MKNFGQMKYLMIALLLIAGMGNQTNNNSSMQTESIHQFQVEDLYGDTFDFASLKGKKVMIVNTASECGLTPQYKDLQALYETYKDSNFVIVGFPDRKSDG